MTSEDGQSTAREVGVMERDTPPGGLHSLRQHVLLAAATAAAAPAAAAAADAAAAAPPVAAAVGIRMAWSS